MAIEKGMYELAVGGGQYYSNEDHCNRYPQRVRLVMSQKDAFILAQNLLSQLADDGAWIECSLSGELTKSEG